MIHIMDDKKIHCQKCRRNSNKVTRFEVNITCFVRKILMFQVHYLKILPSCNSAVVLPDYLKCTYYLLLPGQLTHKESSTKYKYKYLTAGIPCYGIFFFFQQWVLPFPPMSQLTNNPKASIILCLLLRMQCHHLCSFSLPFPVSNFLFLLLSFSVSLFSIFAIFIASIFQVTATSTSPSPSNLATLYSKLHLVTASAV